jgi:autotransporter-associated beta strand protein
MTTKNAAIGFILLITLVAGASPALAANNCRWLGNGADNNWSTVANWDLCGNTFPHNGDSVIFINTAKRGTNVNNIPNLSLASVGLVGQPGDGTAQNPFSRWNISGLPIALTNGITGSSLRTASNESASFLIPVTPSAGALTFKNMPIAPGDTSTRLVLGDINLNGQVAIFDLDFPVTVSGVISGNGALRKVNTSTLTLHDNTYTGPTDIVAGTILAASSSALGSSTLADSTTVEANATLSLANGVVISEHVLLANGILDVPAGVSATFAGPLNAPPPIGTPNNGSFSVGGTLTVTGQVIASDGDVMFLRGGGTLVLMNGANVWQKMLVQNGTVRAGVAKALPQGDLVLLADLGLAQLDLNGFDLTIESLGGGANSGIILGSHTLTINQASAGIYSGTIIGTGGIVKKGVAQLAFNGAQPSTYTGSTTVQEGTLAVGKNPGIPALEGPIVVTGGTLQITTDGQTLPTIPVTVTAPGTFSLTDHKAAIGSLTGNGIVTIGKGTLTVGGNNTTTKFDGTLFGDPAIGGQAAEVYFRLIKVGTGTLTLTNAGSRLSDQFVVDAGILSLDGKMNGSGAIVRGGTLAGNGTIFDNNGLNTFVSNLQMLGATAAISPGHSPGIIHADAAQFSQGSAFVVEINGAAPGTGYDQLDLSNGLVLLDNTVQLVAHRTFPAPKNSTFTIVNLPAGSSTNGTFAGLPEGGNLTIDGQKFGISYRGGPENNDVVLTALEGPPPITYFLSEGATGPFFDEDILIANPNTDTAPVTLTFSKEDGTQVVDTRTLGPQSRLTVHVDLIPGLEGTSVSAQVTSTKGLPLVVERSMFWDKSYYAGSTGSSVDKPAPDWFFAEGSQGFFQTFVLVNNPNPTPTEVTFTFFRENENPVVHKVTVGPTTRFTLDAGSIPEIVNRSFGISVHATQPIMAERSVYFGTTDTRLWSGGTESAGVTSASTHWFLAEGATGGFFDTFILLSNPNNAEAHVTFQYLLPTGETVTVPKTIAANARLTTNIEVEDDVRLHDAAVSTVVTSDQPVIAERSMYWPGAAKPWGEGHNSFGVIDADVKWGLSEGRTGGPLNFHTYILLANPQTTAATVQVTFLRENGTPVVKTFTVPATSRFNIDTGTVTELHDESFGALIEVTNNVPIIVERSMYWDSNGFQFSGGTNATGIHLP